MKKAVTILVLTLALAALVNTVPAMAQEKPGSAKPDFVIGNGTGGVITAIFVSPSKAKYPKDKNRCAIQGLNIADTGTFGVVLPEQMAGIDSFDIELISGGKHFETVKSIRLDRKAGKVPTLELSGKGKDSTRAIIGAGIGGLVGVGGVALTTAALYTGVIMIGQALYAAAIAEALAVAGSIIGGGMVTGVGVIAAVPVAIGVGGYLIGRAFTPEGLEVQVYYR
jgi:hypothetical protein